MPSIETVESFLRRCRERLDEELDPEHNLFTQHELLEYTNEGMRQVHQTMRETHEGWFVRTLRSDGEPVKLNGRQYDVSELKFETDKSEIRLPPDFQELLLFESIPETDGARVPLDLTFKRVITDAFRRNVLEQTDTANCVYCYDIERRNDGAVLVFAPTPTVDAPVHTMLKYVQSPVEVTRMSSFEDTGFEPFMLDAVLAYVVWMARNKEEEGGAAAQSAAAVYESKRQFASRTAGPKQSRDVEVVEGFLEDEIY